MNLGKDQINYYIPFLVGIGLLAEVNGNRIKYVTTDNGHEYLRRFEVLAELAGLDSEV